MIHHPSYYPNRVLAFVKWPVALLSIAALPFVVMALSDSHLASLTFDKCEWLVYGAGGYWLAWFLIFQRQFAGSYFSTFEHECTHALFATATLHRVTGLTVTWRNGGMCEYLGSGGGNWLISIAPYWFPTLVWPPIILTHFLDPSYDVILNVLTGVAIAYHITSTWRETHRGQTDLQQTTFTFAAMFLPTANLVVYGTILLMATSGSDAALTYLGEVWRQLSTFTVEAADQLLAKL